jgi:hypothetical protein
MYLTCPSHQLHLILPVGTSSPYPVLVRSLPVRFLVCVFLSVKSLESVSIFPLSPFASPSTCVAPSTQACLVAEVEVGAKMAVNQARTTSTLRRQRIDIVSQSLSCISTIIIGSRVLKSDLYREDFLHNLIGIDELKKRHSDITLVSDLSIHNCPSTTHVPVRKVQDPFFRSCHRGLLQV